MPQSEADELERPAEGWEYAYVAGVIDYSSGLSIGAQKSNTASIGYTIKTKMFFSSTDIDGLEYISDFCERHGIELKKQNRSGKTIRLQTSKRANVQKLLRLVKPCLIARHTESEILAEKLIPSLDKGEGSTKEGFIKLMGYVDEIRKEGQDRKNVKYDQDYFREKWDC